MKRLIIVLYHGVLYNECYVKGLKPESGLTTRGAAFYEKYYRITYSYF
jgi:hypothetical protein